MTRKRNLDSNAATGVQHPKRVKLSTAQGLSDNSPQCSITSADQDSTPTDVREKGKGKAIESERPETQGGPSRPRMNKLQPPRPFPTVPTSVSATGPRSAHTEGKNYICITRKTSLGAYMRRCKDVIIQDGYKTLHLSAMGAAIPHLVQLSIILPTILPYPPAEIHTEIITGTIEVQDEIIPDDEDEDPTYQKRSKSTLRVVIKIGDGGQFDGPGQSDEKLKGKKVATGRDNAYPREKEVRIQPTLLVLQEPEQGEPGNA